MSIQSLRSGGGYATHLVGKWDLGVATPKHAPAGRGFALCWADVLAGLADLAAREDGRQQLEHLRGDRVHRAVDVDIEEPASPRAGTPESAQQSGSVTVEVCSQQRSLSESRRQLQPKSTVVALTVGRDGRAPPPPLRPQGRLRRQRRHSAGLSAGQGPAAARCVRGRAACAGRVGAAVPDHLGACRKGSPAAADNPDGAPLPPGARRLGFVSALG